MGTLARIANLEVIMKKGFFMALGVMFLCAEIGFGQSLLAPVEHEPDAPPPQAASEKTVQAANFEKVSPLGAPICPCDPTADSGRPLFTFSADYLLWWMRKGPVNGPLVTSGSASDPIPGAIGQPGTHVLFGNELDYHPLSGMRLQAAVNLGSNLAVEGGYFFFERGVVQFSAASDAAGSPVIARPIFNNQAGLQESYGTSNPGAWAGQSDVTSHSALQGAELNLASNLFQTKQNRLDLLFGFRWLNLSEDLVMQDGLAALQPGFLTFLGGPADPPNTLSDFDKFHARNDFYGGQIGARWESQFDRFSIALTGKIALGATQELMTIEGSSTLTTPTGSTTVPGGILAVPSNIGRYYRDAFTAVPEVNVNFNWKLTQRLEATIGYTFLFWSNVARPGSQIDTNVNPALVPTDQSFGNGLGQNRPAFTFHSSSFSAQGLNFGLTYRY
jgi:hypothetical protein